MTEMNTDPRIEKTKAKVHEALLCLCQEKNPSDISISELSSEAGIDRKTFRTHYSSVNDALMELCDAIVVEVTDTFSGELRSDIEKLYDFLDKADNGLKALISGEKSHEFRERFLHGVFSSDAFSECYGTSDHNLIEGYLYSILYIYEEAKRSEKMISARELSGITAGLVMNGVGISV